VVAVEPVGLEVVETVGAVIVVAVIPEEAVVLVRTMMMARTIINLLDPCVGGGRDVMSQSTGIILETNHLKRNSMSLYFFFFAGPLMYLHCTVKFILSFHDMI
jgi:hypothetical protein